MQAGAPHPRSLPPAKRTEFKFGYRSTCVLNCGQYFPNRFNPIIHEQTDNMGGRHGGPTTWGVQGGIIRIPNQLNFPPPFPVRIRSPSSDPIIFPLSPPSRSQVPQAHGGEEPGDAGHGARVVVFHPDQGPPFLPREPSCGQKGH